MMKEGDSIENTIQPPAIDCTEIINQVVERTAEKQQQQMNQLTDMISTLTSLISLHNQQQQVSNSSALTTPHSGVSAIAKAGDITPLNGVVSGNQMTGLINGRVGILPQGDNTAVMVLYHLMMIILHQKELHPIEVGQQAIIRLTMVWAPQIQMIVLFLSRHQMCFLLLMMANALSK